MPIINVKFASPAPTKEVQDELAKEFTDIMINKLGKVPQRIVVQFEELPASNIYFGGVSVEEIKQREKNGLL